MPENYLLGRAGLVEKVAKKLLSKTTFSLLTILTILLFSPTTALTDVAQTPSSSPDSSMKMDHGAGMNRDMQMQKDRKLKMKKHSDMQMNMNRQMKKNHDMKMSREVPMAQKMVAPGMGSKAEILKRSEASIGKNISNFKLVNQNGNHLQFRSLRGKVILMNFIYLDCPDMCILMALSLQKFMSEVDPALKDDFVILSVSFDPKDNTPEKLKDYGSDFTDDFKHWEFTTTDQFTIEAMVEELGFSYEQKGEEFDHLNRLSLIGPDGKVLKHYYGTDYKVEEIEKEIKEAVTGSFLIKRFSGAINSLLLFCSTYNQETRTYETDYFLIANYVIQYLLVIATLYFAYVFLWKEDSKKGED